MNVEEFRRLHLKAAIARFKTQQEFADALGYERSYVNQMLKRKNMGRKVARKIERILGYEPDSFDQNPHLRPLPTLAEPKPSYEPIMPLVPILGTIGLPEGTSYAIPSPGEPSEDYLPSPAHDGAAYALRVVGDELAPRAFDGTFLVAYPSASWDSGDPVIVRLHGGRSFAKQVVYRREDDIALQEFIPTMKGHIHWSRADIAFVHLVIAVFHRKSIDWR